MRWLITLAVVTAAIGFEAICVGAGSEAKLARLRQPNWAPAFGVWAVIGVAWYGLCGFALFRLLARWPVSGTPLLLLILLMMMNGGLNILQFRLERFDLALGYLVAYWLVLAAFLVVAARTDRLVLAIFLVYALYQIYAGAWQFAIWRLNG